MMTLTAVTDCCDMWIVYWYL